MNIVSSDTKTTTEKANHQPDYTSLLIIISILLAAILAINIYQQISIFHQTQITAQRAATYDLRIKEISGIAYSQQATINNLFNDYQKDAYNNPKVTRITDQQLVAAEYTIQALQIIGNQNYDILQILSAQP